MQARLEKVVRFPVMKLLIDFDNVGYENLEQWQDITNFVLDISGSTEKSGTSTGGISTDLLTFVVDNSGKEFLNSNPLSPFYGKIKPKIRYVLKAGFKEETLINYMVGYVDKFEPRRIGKEFIIKCVCPFERAKKEEPPRESFKDISWDEAVNILLDKAGIEQYFIRNIPKTEYFMKYLRFESDSCFDELLRLLEICAGSAYLIGNEIKFDTKLALDYQYSNTPDHELTIDDMESLDEQVSDTNIINKVSIKAEPKEIDSLQVIYETPENFVKVENERHEWDGTQYIFIKEENLPLYWSEGEEEITIKNLTNNLDIEWATYNAELGRITLSPVGMANCSLGDILSVSYTYQFLVLLPGQTRKYVMELEGDIDSINEPDVIAWNALATETVPYVHTPNTPDTISKQLFTYDEEDQVVTLALKNNTTDKIAISTLQVRGYPIVVKNSIEVNRRDNPSINEYQEQSVEISTDLINNVSLAEKLSEYIIFNNAQPRTDLTINISGYPEFTLDDIVKATDSETGMNLSFTVERIDFSFNLSNGWDIKANLKELDAAPWIYEQFNGYSHESRVPPGNTDFIKEINANIVMNGGAELYSEADDQEDIQAISGLHRIPDYWNFTRLTGDASARLRNSGALVLHGGNSFEIVTTNGGSGYFWQKVTGVKVRQPYALTFMASNRNGLGKVSLVAYNSSNVELTRNEVVIDNYDSYEIKEQSHINTAYYVIELHMLSDSGIREMFFDKVKLENSIDATVYVETEETSAVQLNKTYANSLTIGNNLGVSVFDENLQPRVILGQYEPQEYGLKVFDGSMVLKTHLNENLGMVFDIDGIRAYDPNGGLTFDIDSWTGDALFKGTLEASVVNGSEINGGTINGTEMNSSVINGTEIYGGKFETVNETDADNKIIIQTGSVISEDYTLAGYQGAQLSSGGLSVLGIEQGNGFDGIEYVSLERGRLYLGNTKDAYLSFNESTDQLRLVNDLGEIFINPTTRTRILGDILLDGGRLDISSSTYFSGIVDFSSASVSGLTISNASYADNAGTLDGYDSSAFSFSGHSHSDYSYVKPSSGQAIQVGLDTTNSRMNWYLNGSYQGSTSFS